MDFPTAATTLGLSTDELSQLALNPQFPATVGTPTLRTNDGWVTSYWDYSTVSFDSAAVTAFAATMAAVAANGWVVLYEGLSKVDWAKLAATQLPIAGRNFYDPGSLVRMSIPLSKITAPTTVSGRVEIYRQRIRDGAPLPPLALWRSPGGVDSWSIVSGRDLYQAASLEGLTTITCVIANGGPASTADAAVDVLS
jgi:hypothetical protein